MYIVPRESYSAGAHSRAPLRLRLTSNSAYVNHPHTRPVNIKVSMTGWLSIARGIQERVGPGGDTSKRLTHIGENRVDSGEDLMAV